MQRITNTFLYYNEIWNNSIECSIAKPHKSCFGTDNLFTHLIINPIQFRKSDLYVKYNFLLIIQIQKSIQKLMRKNIMLADQNLAIESPVGTVPKMNKLKFIKELNHKTNSVFNGRKTNSNIIYTKKHSNLVVEKQKNSQKQGSKGLTTNDSHFWSENSKNFSVEIVRRDGQVSFTDANGNKFTGIYQNGMRVQGKIIYTNANCEYEGSFLGQKFHGHGKLTYYDGRTIEGEWQEQVLVGSAIISYPNGDVYYGDVNQQLYKHGQGHLFFKNGDKYVGRFSNGSINGFGAFYQQEKITAKGHWIQRKLVKQVNNVQQNLEDSNSYNLDEVDTLDKHQKVRNQIRKNINQQNRKENIFTAQSSNLSRKITQSSHNEKNETSSSSNTSTSGLFTFSSIKQ